MATEQANLAHLFKLDELGPCEVGVGIDLSRGAVVLDVPGGELLLTPVHAKQVAIALLAASWLANEGEGEP